MELSRPLIQVSNRVWALPTPSSVSIGQISPFCVENITVYMRAHALYCQKNYLTHTPHTSHTQPTPKPSQREGAEKLDFKGMKIDTQAQKTDYLPPSLWEGLGVGLVWEVWVK